MADCFTNPPYSFRIQELSFESITEIPEDQLVERLLADSHWRNQRLLNIYGIPKDVEVYPRVNHDKLGKQGDIDILVVNPNKPEFATAIQVKRIKVVDKTFEKDNPPNKLGDLKIFIGSRTYLWISVFGRYSAW